MVYYPQITPVTDNMREIVERKEKDFPHVAMAADLKNYPGRRTSWHWHEYFEFCTVKEGCLSMNTRRGPRIVRAGEGYFINANVLHENCTAHQDVGALLHAQLFDRSLIAGTGLVGRRYVAPVENCVDLDTLIFSPEDAAGRAVISHLDAAFSAAENDSAGHELMIAAHLNAAWARLFEMVSAQIRANAGRGREETSRIKAMLSFIHENYSLNLSVREIAAAAGVCERECFRSFAEVLNTTPMAYLSRHRVGVAARALAETNASVSRIAEDCGFSNSSYFGKVFRQIMGCSPLVYRKNCL